MFPQTELDNYKLQVELLQEKLKRSEEQRKQLEGKFDGIIRKRSEEEKMMKIKSRIKYQQFLEEQRQRNERNKALVKLLDHVDQQAAGLAARSERLRMMKHQYELYFAKLLQAQNMRSIQNSPRHYSMIPLNHIITNANLPIGIQDICQSSSNLSKGSPTVTENWGMMPNNTITGNSNLPYRFPGNVDYFNGQILLSQEPLQRQVNLKSTFGDSMAPSSGYQAQIGTFADTRRNPIEFEHSKETDFNMSAPQTNDRSPLRASRPDNHNRNPKQILNSRQMCTEGDLNGEMGYIEQDSTQVEIFSKSGRTMTSDKLPNIKQSGTHERLVAEVNENDNKTDAIEKDDENGEAMNNLQRSITTPDKGRQKTDVSMANWISVEKQAEKVQSLFPRDVHEKNISTPTLEKPRNPVMWNFGGRIDPVNAEHPIQLGKKKKLSIENIEDAIYGERIIPGGRRTDPIADHIDDRIPKGIINDVITKEDVLKNWENHDEKSDISEKVEKSYVKDETEVTSGVESKPATPVSDTSTPPMMQQEQSTKDDETKIEEPIDRQYTEEYSTNSEEVLRNEDSIKDEGQTAADNNTLSTKSDYISDQPKPVEQYETDQQNFAGSEVAYPPSDQYQPGDYQYQQQVDYAQGEEYADYQNGQYQGEYQQQQYDMNAYNYNYGQPQEGYNQDGLMYQQNPEGYQVADGSYQQGNATYDQYQQGTDGTYTESGYKDPNQQNYPGVEYNTQMYDPSMYSNEYQQGAEFSGYTNPTNNAQNVEVESMPTEPESVKPETPEAEVSQSAGPDPESTKSPEHTSVQDTTTKPEEKTPEEVKSPKPPAPNVMPQSILSTEKPNELNPNKKKKKVNFVDSETEESSSSAKPENPAPSNDESDFDFSSNSK